MPFFDANKFRLEIELQQPRCFVGGIIQGVCRIACSEPATARGIVLGYKCRIERRVDYDRAMYDRRNQQMDKLIEDKFKDLTLLFHSAEYLLFGSRQGSVVTIEPGEYTYPFAIPIPMNVPPTLGGNAGICKNDCCTCCCDYCNYATSFFAVTHFLEASVIIAYSLMDAKVQWPVKVLTGINTQEYQYQHRHVKSITGGNASCMSCCPGMASMFTLESHGLTICLEKRVFVVGRDAGIHVWVWGDIPYDFTLSLTSEQKDPMVPSSEKKWVSHQNPQGGVEVFRKPREGHIVPEHEAFHGYLNFTGIQGRIGQLPSLRLEQCNEVMYTPLQIDYFVAVNFVYNTGCWQGPMSDVERPWLKIQLVQGDDLRIPISQGALQRAAAEAAIRSQGMGGAPPTGSSTGSVGADQPGQVMTSSMQQQRMQQQQVQLQQSGHLQVSGSAAGYPPSTMSSVYYPPQNAQQQQQYPPPGGMMPPPGGMPPAPLYAQQETVTYQYVPPVPQQPAPPGENFGADGPREPEVGQDNMGPDMEPMPNPPLPAFNPAAPVQEEGLPAAAWGVPMEYFLIDGQTNNAA